MKKERTLSNKQKKFVEEYFVDLNATAAARRAGYSLKTAQGLAAQNMSKPLIQEAIKEKQRLISEQFQVTRDSVINDLLEIKNNCKVTNPNASIKALDLIVKICGFNAPTEQNIKLSGEQPLFGPITD